MTNEKLNSLLLGNGNPPEVVYEFDYPITLQLHRGIPQYHQAIQALNKYHIGKKTVSLRKTWPDGKHGPMEDVHWLFNARQNKTIRVQVLSTGEMRVALSSIQARTADNVEIKVGMTIYVLSNVEGGPVSERIVGEIESKFSVLYDKPDSQGYIGCRTGWCFADKKKAENNPWTTGIVT